MMRNPDLMAPNSLNNSMYTTVSIYILVHFTVSCVTLIISTGKVNWLGLQLTSQQVLDLVPLVAPCPAADGAPSFEEFQDAFSWRNKKEGKKEIEKIASRPRKDLRNLDLERSKRPMPRWLRECVRVCGDKTRQP